MAPIGIIAQIAGSAITGAKAARDKKLLANDQKAKARELLTKANNVVTKRATDDPAYKLKAFLAQSGVPGYEDYLEEINGNTQDQLIAAEKGASSGASLLNLTSSLEGGADAQKRNLGAVNDNFKVGQKNNLASMLYSMQTGFDAQAKSEKEGLNAAATQYEQAGTLNKSAANEQVATTVGTAFSQVGQAMDGMSGSGNVSMGNLSSMFGKSQLASGNSQGSFKSSVPNVALSQQEAQQMATSKGITIQDLLNMGFVIK